MSARAVGGMMNSEVLVSVENVGWRTVMNVGLGGSSSPLSGVDAFDYEGPILWTDTYEALVEIFVNGRSRYIVAVYRGRYNTLGFLVSKQ